MYLAGGVIFLFETLAPLIPSGIFGFFRLGMNFVRSCSLSLSYKAVIKNFDLEANDKKTRYENQITDTPQNNLNETRV